MSSETVIANLALMHAGVGKRISSLTQASEAARCINELWTPTMKELQRETIWNFNTRIAQLTLVSSTTIAYSTRWARAYRYLPEALRIQAVLPSRDSDGTITDLSIGGKQVDVPFATISDSAGRLILTNEAGAEARYSHFEEQVDLWPPDFQMCASLRLAAYALVSLGKGDPFKIGQRALTLFEASLTKARETDAREGVSDDDAERSDMIDSRG